MSKARELLLGVQVALIEAVGGTDVPDEATVGTIQADWYRNQAAAIEQALELLP